MFSADLGGQATSTGTQFLAVTTVNTPYIRVYPWSSAGFGSAFSNPSSLPASILYNNCIFSSRGNYVGGASGGNSDPKTPAFFFTAIYPWTLSGFGTKYSESAYRTQTNARSAAMSPTEGAFLISVDASVNSQKIIALRWSSSGFGLPYSAPSSPPTSIPAPGMCFSPSGDAVVVPVVSPPYAFAYPWSDSTGFGTKFSDPTTSIGSMPNAATFSSSGNVVAFGTSASPHVVAYAWSGSGFGSRFSNPATLITTACYGVSFTPAGDAIALASSGTPFIHAYQWSGSGFGSKFSNPSTLPPSNGTDCKFSPLGDALAVTHSLSPGMTVYAWSGSGFGAKFSNPSILPDTSGANACAFGVIP